MRFFMGLAKLLMVIIWGLLLSNLFFPFSGQISFVFYLLLGFMSVMHLLQLLLIHVAFSTKIKLTRSDALQIFIFGIFKLWQIKKRIQI